METNETNEEQVLKQEEQKMQDELNVGIGTKESVALQPAIVKIVDVQLQPIMKNGKEIGKKVVCLSKHPSKEEAIAISTVKFEKANQIKESGLWLNKDEDDLIRKGSALAVFMEKIEATTIKAIVDKQIATVMDDKGYLAFKAY